MKLVFSMAMMVAGAMTVMACNNQPVQRVEVPSATDPSSYQPQPYPKPLPPPGYDPNLPQMQPQPVPPPAPADGGTPPAPPPPPAQPAPNLRRANNCVKWISDNLQNHAVEKVMLKKACALGLLLPLAFAMSGCTDPIPAFQDPLPDYPQVHVEAYLLQNLIRVQSPILSHVGAGQLRVDIPIRNLADRDLPIDFVYYFYDQRGVLIAPPSSRQFVSIPRKGISQIEFTSLSAAADFRVEIRYAK